MLVGIKIARLKMKIYKIRLFLIAGLLWCFAGIMVTMTGIKAWTQLNDWWINALALVIYLVFYLFIFSKLVRKHERRIMEHPKEKLPWWQFFDKKSYIIMICMMTFGMLLRKSGFLPIWFFSFFYTGLGIALFTCGLRFLYLVFKYRGRN